MKLSTSSNIVFDRPEGPFFHMDRMMRYAKEAGFDTLDISFYDWALPGSPFLTDEWKKWIDQVAEEKERLGLDRAMLILIISFLRLLRRKRESTMKS